MSDFMIRSFEERDATLTSQLLREAFEWFHKGDQESWLWKSFEPSNILSNSKTQEILVALDDSGKVVGYISSTTTIYGVAYVPTVGVDPWTQRKGLGKLLLEEKISRLRAKGIRKVWLLVTSTNSSAISFYLKNDFVIEGFLRDHTGPGSHEILFSKFL